MVLDDLDTPIVLAPLAGGPSTPELAAAVSNAGGLGFLGAGYLTADALGERIRATRELTAGPIAVNLFVISGEPADPATYIDYVDALGPEAGRPRFDDDEFDAKVEQLASDPAPVVSFTFGLPPRTAIDQLRAVGSEIWITVTSPDEANAALDAGADVLVAQGAEAGGHRGSFDDGQGQPVVRLAPLLEGIRAINPDAPVVAAGGLASAVHVAGALTSGARAAAAGTAFMLAPEAGTFDAHREAIASEVPTALTRAFTGRLARGIRNQFMEEHPDAPCAYPEIHYATAPIRAAARKAGDPSVVNLWAGEAHQLAVTRPAADTVAALTP